MKKILNKKIIMLNEINELLSNSISTAIVNYAKTKSLDIKLLRKELFNNNLKIKVLKNTITKKALINTSSSDLIPYIKGQILMIFSANDVSKHIKIIDNFNKRTNSLKTKAVCVYGKIFIDNEIQKIRNLNSKETEIYNIITTINTPLILLANILKVLIKTKIGEKNVN